MRVLRSLFGVVAVFVCAAAADATGSVKPGTLSVAAGVIGTPESYVGSLPVAGSATRAYLSTPAGLAIDQAGDLYVADPGSDVIVKVTSAGVLSIVAGTGRHGAPTPGPATQSDLNDPWGLAVDSVGNLYIADIGNKVVEKVTPAGTLSVVAGTGRQGAPTPGLATQSDLARPQSVAVGPSGDLYIADLGNNDVDEVTPDGTLSVIAGTGAYGQPTPGPATSSRLDRPDGVAVDSSGDIFVADEAASAVILKISTGRLSIVAGMLHRSGGLTPGPATKTALGGPLAVAVDSAGNLYVADTPNNCVEEVTPAGVISIIAGTGVTGLPGPYQAELNNLVSPQGIAVGPGGTLYIASTLSRIVEEEADAPDAHSFGAPTAAVGSARVHRAKIRQTLSCLSGAAPCRVTATLKTAVSGRRRITLARRRLTIAVGSFKTMTVTPSRTGRALLRKLVALRTSLTITPLRPTRLTTRFRGTFILKSRVP